MQILIVIRSKRLFRLTQMALHWRWLMAWIDELCGEWASESEKKASGQTRGTNQSITTTVTWETLLKAHLLPEASQNIQHDKACENEMLFASEFVFVDIDNEMEEIFVDEIEDGVAAGAERQAEIWLEALKEDPEANKEFMASLVSNFFFFWAIFCSILLFF